MDLIGKHYLFKNYFMQIDPFLGKGERLQDDRMETRRTELKNEKMESERLSDSQNF